jgi:hypothetical protein
MATHRMANEKVRYLDSIATPLIVIYRAIHLRLFDPRQVERCHLAIVQKLVETTDTREFPRSCLLSAVFVGEVGLVILDVGDIELLETYGRL